MNIVFSTKPSEKHQTYLTEKFSKPDFYFYEKMDMAQAALPDAEVLVTYGGDLTPELIRKSKKLKWIMLLSAGMDDMPLNEIEEAGILMTNVRGIHKTPMSEYAISMLLQVYRQAKAMMKNQENHVWNKKLHMREISGSTMVVVGAGAIGQEVARLAKAFGMKTIGVSRTGRNVAYFDQNEKVENLKDVLPQADFIVSVLPSTNETRYLYTMEHFKLMPDHAVFLNMGRGDVVSTDVLLEAIRNQEIAHAVLDVFETEPLPADSPLWDEENITVTPHISGLSPLYMSRGLEIFSQNLEAYLSAKIEDMQNRINVSQGY